MPTKTKVEILRFQGPPCPGCKKPLVRIAWNNTGNILTCHTPGCQWCDTPVFWIAKGADAHHIPMNGIFESDRYREIEIDV